MWVVKQSFTLQETGLLRFPFSDEVVGKSDFGEATSVRLLLLGRSVSTQGYFAVR